MRQPRITTRRLMIAVAVVGATLCIERIREHQRRCQVVALFHSREAEYELSMADLSPVYMICGTALASMSPDERQRETQSRPSRLEHRSACLRRAEYHISGRREKFLNLRLGDIGNLSRMIHPIRQNSDR